MLVYINTTSLHLCCLSYKVINFTMQYKALERGDVILSLLLGMIIFVVKH